MSKAAAMPCSPHVQGRCKITPISQLCRLMAKPLASVGGGV